MAEPVSGPGTGTTVSEPSDPGTVWLIRCLAQHGDCVADPVSGFKEKILEYGPLDGSVGGCVLYAT